MASQLNLTADYAGTDATLKTLEEGEDGIKPIKLTSVELNTKSGSTTPFTKEIAVKFKGATGANWSQVARNNWKDVTDFGDLTDDATFVQKVEKLTTVYVTNNKSCKFLMLPQKAISSGVDEGAVVVNTTYGKVFIADPAVSGSKLLLSAKHESPF